MLSQKTIEEILALQKLYPEPRSALIPALHLAQDEVGFLPLEAQECVAGLFCIDATEVRALVSFYDMFHEEPIGKHCIHVCKNASCMLRGADDIFAELCEKLKIVPGEMSKDGEFTVFHSECLGACDRAPMMLVDEEVIGPVTEHELDTIIERVRHG
jgi:NADH-quinone oxidoreductase subunit E